VDVEDGLDEGGNTEEGDKCKLIMIMTMILMRMGELRRLWKMRY